MKKSFFLFIKLPLLLGLIMSSCNDKEQAISGFYMNRIFSIQYVSVDGTNILQNDSPIEVYYEKNGIAQKVERSNLDYPNGFTITSQRNTAPNGSDELCVKVFPSDYYDDEDISTTHIKLGDHQMDTIQCQFNITSNSIYLTKTWLNGTLCLGYRNKFIVTSYSNYKINKTPYNTDGIINGLVTLFAFAPALKTDS